MDVIKFTPNRTHSRGLGTRRGLGAEIIRPFPSGVLWYRGPKATQDRGPKATQACRRWHTKACPGGIDRRVSDQGFGK